MQLLAQRIESVLQDERQCFIRPEQLHRVWPQIDDGQREQAVRDFAHEHGWRIFNYSRVLGAMFVRET
jgi:hypothetical protein